MGVTFFHEMTHYQNHVSENTNNDIAISDLSVQYNNEYYHAMHHKLPHEIKAEYSGVMSMWSALESEWPDAADRLMFDYLDYRTEKSDRVGKPSFGPCPCLYQLSAVPYKPAHILYGHRGHH